MEFLKVEDNQLQVNETFLEIMAEYRKQKLEFEKQEKDFKYALLKAMKQNNIKSFTNDLVTITFKDGYMRKGVDTDKLKRDGLYDEYAYEVPVEESVSVRWKD